MTAIVEIPCGQGIPPQYASRWLRNWTEAGRCFLEVDTTPESFGDTSAGSDPERPAPDSTLPAGELDGIDETAGQERGDEAQDCCEQCARVSVLVPFWWVVAAFAVGFWLNDENKRRR